MADPPSPTGVERPVRPSVVVSDEQADIDLDAQRWADLATAVLAEEGRTGELTLTFIDTDEMASLNAEHMGGSGATDVLSFPLDADEELTGDATGPAGAPVLLGDVVICPAVAAAQAAAHAGTLDDELALLTVHGVLHVLGHDHAESVEAERMRSAELIHLQRSHWRGPVPDNFRQEHVDA